MSNRRLSSSPITVRRVHIDEYGHEHVFYVTMVPQKIGCCGLSVEHAYRAKITLQAGLVGGADAEQALIKLQGLAELFVDSAIQTDDLRELMPSAPNMLR